MDPKRIIICCDGTWQSSVSEKNNIPSNVTRLCRHIARSGIDENKKYWQQIVYYDSGVGTGSISAFESKRQGAFGDGLAVNVIEAYNFIVNNYEKGDEIFCFGFSRGAYTARAVAGLVTDIGVLHRWQMQSFPEVYGLYKKYNDRHTSFTDSPVWNNFMKGVEDNGKPVVKWQKDQSAKFIERWNSPAGQARFQESREVKVVGVWDTVGSVGIPDSRWIKFGGNRAQYGFHNVELNEHVRHAYQALALDERRNAFQPCLWYIPARLKELPVDKQPELKQVWFPGMHINIGGGSDDLLKKNKGDHEQMALITWAWMLECIKPHLTLDSESIKHAIEDYGNLLEALEHPCVDAHKPPSTGWFSTLKSFLANPFRRTPAKHYHRVDRGWGTGVFVDSFSGLMAWPGEHTRVPTRSIEEHKCTRKDAKGNPLPQDPPGETNEFIHPVTEFRRRRIEKFPPQDKLLFSLHEFTRRVEAHRTGTGFLATLAAMTGWKWLAPRHPEGIDSKYLWSRRKKQVGGKTVGFEWHTDVDPVLAVDEYVVGNGEDNFERLVMAADKQADEETTFLAEIAREIGV